MRKTKEEKRAALLENRRVAATLNDEGCRNLLVGIVKQAVDDYRQALRINLKHPESESAKDTIRECERFFRDGIETYLDIDGEYIMQSVRKLVKQEVEEKADAIKRATERKSAKERISAGVPAGACGDKQDLPTAGTVETGHDVSVGDD